MTSRTEPREPLAAPIRVFSDGEKRELAGQEFREVMLDRIDFAGADLRGTRFDTVSLRGCDFRGADLRAARFLDCDLREANLVGVLLADTRFDRSWVGGATGLTVEQIQQVSMGGGVFLTWGSCPTGHLGTPR